MNVDQLVSFLDDRSAASMWLSDIGVRDTSAGHQHLVSMASHGMTLDLLTTLSEQLSLHLPVVGDPDLALATLCRFVAASRNPLSLGTLIEQDDDALPTLLQLFSASPMLGDMLVADPAAYDLVRLTEGQPVSREHLVGEICGEVAGLSSSRDVMAALRQFKERETLRIAYGDIIRKQSSDTVASQLSFLADAVCEAAVTFTRRVWVGKRGKPRNRDGQPTRFVMIGLRRLGGNEQDYSTTVRGFFIYEEDGRTDGDRPIDNREFFDKVCADTLQLLGEETELGVAYKVNVEKTPAQRVGRWCLTQQETINYFDSRGRTWERQSLVKARPIAGDTSLGLEFLDAIEPWVYRRYLSRADITGIKALKRRLERRTERNGAAVLDVEGGVLDLEFTVQYLQLINGGDQREVRVGNTLRAIEQLEQAGSITPEEASALRNNYDSLRRVEHRLEIMLDPTTHELPNDEAALRKLALRCGYDDVEGVAKLFQQDYEQLTAENRQIINRLLEDMFAEDLPSDPAAELLLDHNPDPEAIQQVLADFRDPIDAYHNLSALAVENIPFLSTRRCRHFLSLIVQQLLANIAQTPSPDATLASLCRVSDSIGGKGVLWELFHLNRPSLDLYVRLCSSSPYLTTILTRYPGMIDELLDSLMLPDLPTLGEMQAALALLCNNVEDIRPVLHSFKHTQHLNVGVRELLGKADIKDSTAALSDVAESCLQHVTWHQHRKLVRKFGQPFVGNSDVPSELIVLGMGKFGGREPNYHSDVEVIFLFDGKGNTQHPPTIRNRDTTSNQHFFGELGQRIAKTLSENTEFGRLYEVDTRFRPLGASGPNAASLEDFRNHYMSAPQTFAELRGLCRARPVYGSEETRAKAAQVLRDILTQPQILRLDGESVRHERHLIQETAGPRNLKRGPGGVVDIEFIAQTLQLRNASQNSDILKPNTIDAINALKAHGFLAEQDADFLCESYKFLRRVEARLRLLNTTARHDLPREGDELAKLAYLMQIEHSAKLESECAKYAKQNRRLFDSLIG